MQGKLITFEGGEGAGKTTVIQTVLKFLEEAGVEVVSTREPGGTPFGEAVREAILHSPVTVCAEAELLAMFAARAQHLHDVIRPALQAGRWVVCSRFVDSSYAYQGGGRKVPEDVIRLLDDTFVRLSPDLTFYLDLPPQFGHQRIACRPEGLDRIEREDMAFFRDVRQAYLDRASRSPGRIRLIDASRSPATVAADICDGLKGLVQAAHDSA